jgi:hypothetical protein
LPGSQPASEATAAKLAIVTAEAATRINGWVLRVGFSMIRLTKWLGDTESTLACLLALTADTNAYN